MRPTRFQLALAVAAFAHAMAWLERPTGTIAPNAPVIASSLDEATIEIDTSEAPQTAGPSGASTGTEAHAGTSTPGLARTFAGEHGRDDSSAAAPSDSASAAPSSSAPVMSVWNMDALAQRELGVGDTRSFAAPPPPISDSEIARSRIQRTIEDGLRDHELASGDPVSGPIVRALEDSTSRSLAPVNGRATFDAVIDAGGVLLSIGTVDTTSNKTAWDDVAKASVATLTGHKLRTSKRGVVVRIEIASREQLPSGASRGVGGDVLGDGSGTPHAVDVHVLPTAPSTKDGWGRKTDFTPLSGSFDVSDIGAHAQRVVGAHVMSVRDL